MDKHCLGNTADIEDGKAVGFDINNSGEDTFFVVRKGAEFFAYTDVCPHYGDTTLPWKRHQYLDSSAQYIVCAAHGALFEIGSGDCIQGPCMGQKLQKIPVEVSSTNEIWISLQTLKEFNL